MVTSTRTPLASEALIAVSSDAATAKVAEGPKLHNTMGGEESSTTLVTLVTV